MTSSEKIEHQLHIENYTFLIMINMFYKVICFLTDLSIQHKTFTDVRSFSYLKVMISFEEQKTSQILCADRVSCQLISNLTFHQLKYLMEHIVALIQ